MTPLLNGLAPTLSIIFMISTCLPTSLCADESESKSPVTKDAETSTPTNDKDADQKSNKLYSDDGFRTLVDRDKTKIELKNTIVLDIIKAHNSNFGAGSADIKNPTVIRHNPLWEEYTYNPELRVTQGFSNTSEMYMRLTAVAAGTAGQGDAGAPSTTSNKPFLFDTEEACIGWRSGKLAGKIDNLIDISVGNQSFKIGDRLIVSDGTSDAYRRSSFFYGPRSAFRETAIVKINTQPVRGKIFHLRNNVNQRYMRGTDQPRSMFYGGDLEYVNRDEKDASKEIWKIGGTFLYFYQADSSLSNTSINRNRNGLQVYNPRIGGNFFSWNRDIVVNAGYVNQRNRKSGRATNAHAYYIEPGYSFSKVWGNPLLMYRYMYYSGESNPGSSVKKSYDPLFQGYWVDGFGKWEIGEAYGQFYFANSNQKVHNVRFKINPTDKHTLCVMYYNIRFDHAQQAGATSKRAADEWDVYAKWNPNQWFELAAVAGALIPKTGVKQLTIAANPNTDPLRIGKTMYFGYLAATFTF